MIAGGPFPEPASIRYWRTIRRREPLATFIGTITRNPDVRCALRIPATRLVVSMVLAGGRVSALGGVASVPVKSAPATTTTSLPRAWLACSGALDADGPRSAWIFLAASR